MASAGRFSPRGPLGIGLAKAKIEGSNPRLNIGDLSRVDGLSVAPARAVERRCLAVDNALKQFDQSISFFAPILTHSVVHALR
jgi:hypothetical protein